MRYCLGEVPSTAPAFAASQLRLASPYFKRREAAEAARRSPKGKEERAVLASASFG